MNKWFYLAFVVVAVGVGILASRQRNKPVRPITAEDRAEVERLARAGHHIEAMRAYRKATHASLKDAKAAVEAIERAG